MSECETCGSTHCDCCGAPLEAGKFIHIYWHHDLCDECNGSNEQNATFEETS